MEGGVAERQTLHASPLMTAGEPSNATSPRCADHRARAVASGTEFGRTEKTKSVLAVDMAKSTLEAPKTTRSSAQKRVT